MIICVFANIFFLATIFAMYRYFAFIPLSVMFLLLMMVTWKYKQEFGIEKLVLGTITSFFAPCLILKDSAYYYLKNGIFGNVLSIGLVWLMYGLTILEIPAMQSIMASTIFECRTQLDTSILKIDRIYRCNSNNITDTENCSPGLISLTGQYSQTICPRNYGQWWIFLILCIILTLLKVLSILSIGLMDYLTDEMQKLNFGRKFCYCKLWKQKDMYWYDYACAYVDGKSYDEVDNQTNKDIKQSFLMLSIQSGFFGFTKVQTGPNQSILLMFQKESSL